MADEFVIFLEWKNKLWLNIGRGAIKTMIMILAMDNFIKVGGFIKKL